MSTEQPTTATKPAHTPTPWQFSGRRISSSESVQLANVTEYSVNSSLERDEANAELIVRAVNTYEQTQAEVAELREASAPFLDESVRLKWMGDKDGRIYLSVTKEEYDKARAVLARHAQGEGSK